MAGETAGTGGANSTTAGGDSTSDASADAMVQDLLDAADKVRQMGLKMSIAGYDAQAASKHP